MKKLKIRENRYEPRIINGIIKCINKKHRLFKASLTIKSATSILKYKTKNQLASTVHLADKNYYINKFDTADESIRNTWKLL